MLLNHSKIFRVNRFHERAFRIVYNKIQSTFEELFPKINLLIFTITEIQKALHNISRNIYGGLFIRNNSNLNLRYRLELKFPLLNSELKVQTPYTTMDLCYGIMYHPQ